MIYKPLFKLLSKSVLQPWHRLARGMTLGTRTLVFEDGMSKVLLVRHTYADGWMLPGGGVERGETIYESGVREVREEAGIIAREQPELAGFCSNHEHFPGDHLAILLLRNFDREPFKANGEIAAAEFFPVTQLPGDATAGTRRRIAEAAGGRATDPLW